MTMTEIDPTELQALLMNQGFDVVIDGVVGPHTKSALRAFQARHGLPATGDCDDATLDALHQ
jgi:peptidoglycan hydrolase-like protein with peptidoglycan-binding domain